MIFKHICKKGNKYLTKIIFKEGEGEKWATTSEAVYNWAKKNFKDGDTIDVQYNIKNGQYFVNKIMKSGSGTKKTKKEETPKETAEYTCEDCGKELKDDKYKKCYTCNKKNPTKRTSGTYKKSPEVQESILRQCVANATSRVLNVLTGQLDLNTIGEVFDTMYDRILKKVKGK